MLPEDSDEEDVAPKGKRLRIESSDEDTSEMSSSSATESDGGGRHRSKTGTKLHPP